jgi:hypothetical protein
MVCVIVSRIPYEVGWISQGSDGNQSRIINHFLIHLCHSIGLKIRMAKYCKIVKLSECHEANLRKRKSMPESSLTG